MTCKEIYEAALSLIAESTDPADTADYAERAPYLIAAFCSELADIDRLLREHVGQKTEAAFSSLCLALNSEFPLLPKLASAAAIYLAAMLVIDDFPDLSDRLYGRYCDTVSRIYTAVVGKAKSTANKYFAD